MPCEPLLSPEDAVEATRAAAHLVIPHPPLSTLAHHDTMSAYRNKNGPSTSGVQDRLGTVSQRLNFFLPMNHSANTSTAAAGPVQQQQSFANGNNGNGNAGNMNGNGTAAMSANGEDPVAGYTLQGVMQWLNGEYRRYERERNNWEIERAALVVRAFLGLFG